MFSVSFVTTGKPRAMAPAPQATMTSSRGLKALTNAGTRSIVYFIRLPASPGVMLPKIRGSAQRDGDDMDDGGDVLAERDDADIVAGLVALLLELVDDAAHEGDEDALALVALHERDGLIGRGAEPRITATPGMSPVTSGTPRLRMTASDRWP